MSDATPANTMRERVGGRLARVRLALQLGVGRLRLTALLCVAFFAVVLAASVLVTPPLRQRMADGADPVETLYQALVTVLVTGVTLVVTINQVVLSQETGPLGDQRERMAGALSFRDDAERHFGTVSPAEPAAFLQALVDASRERAVAVREAVDEEAADDVVAFLDSLVDHADEVSDRLDGAEFGRYDVVQAALDYNYSWKIHRARRLRLDRADDLDDDAAAEFDDLIEVLQLFGPAREHVKTLFFQWELVGLSRRILYLSIPALAAAVVVLLFLDAGSVPGRTLGVDNLHWVVAATTTAAVAPFLLLASYVVRLATIARRTLAIGPFILRDTERSGLEARGTEEGEK